jgi:glycosyltransferase 2 family protein
MRVKYLKKYSQNTLGRGVSNFVLEKVFDFISLFLIVSVSAFMIKSLVSGDYFYYAIGGFFALLAFLLVFMDINRSKVMLKLFYRFIPEKIKGKARESFYSFYEHMPSGKYFFIFFIINLINWIVIYSIFYFVGLSIGINVSYFYFLLFMPIATFIGQIPITINGLGTREAAMISLFAIIGVNATKVFSMSLINLFLNGVLPSLIGIIYIIKEDKINDLSP